MGKKLEMIKTGAKVGVSLGVSALVTSVIKNNTDTENAGICKKLCMGVAALVLTSMIADKATSYLDEKVDSALAGAKNMAEDEEKSETEKEIA